MAKAPLDIPIVTADENPASGRVVLYSKDGTNFFLRNSAGTETEISGGSGTTLPVTDTTAIVKGSVDATKLLRFEVDGLTTATTRVATMPDADITLGTDADAIHDNVAGEVNALTEKITPVSGDLIIIEDSADGFTKKKSQIGNLPSGGSTVASEIQLTASGASLPTANPALRGTIETTTNAVLIPVLAFDQTTDEFAQWTFNLPSDYSDGSTVTAQFVWSAASGTGDVVWGLQGVAFQNDDPLDAAFGTAQTVTDTLLATEDNHVTSATSAITIAGSPTSGDLVVFRAYRDADNVSDTLTADAQLINVIVSYTRA